MAVPRPVLVALLGLALVSAAFLATRGAREPGGSVTAVPATATPAPAPATKHATAPGKTRHSAASKHDSTSNYAADAQDAAREATKSAAPGSKSRSHEATKPATRSATPSAPAGPSAPAIAARVKQALAHGNVVVFF